ncbi:MAG: signal peptidase II [bacterium]
MLIAFYIILIGLLILADQLSKKIILEGFRFKWNWFEIILVYNEGSAFGIKLLKNNEYILVNSFILLILLIFTLFKARNNKFANYYYTSFSFIAAGGIGNLIDRIIHGKVVDFIAVYHFPVFNLADSFITIGSSLLILIMLIDKQSKTGK